MNEEAIKDEKNIYELAILLKDEGDLARVSEMIRQHSGELTSEPRAKKLALAYKIKGHTEAVFVSCLFRATGADAKSLEEDLRTRGEAIRSMVLRAPKVAEQPTGAMPTYPSQGQGRPSYSRPASAAPAREAKPAPREPLSNEALEDLLKKI